MQPRSRIPLLLMVAAALAARPSPAASQAVEAWFAESDKASTYTSISEEILALSDRLRAHGIPDRPLADRLAEGAIKRVDPQRLAQALGEETLRIEQAAAALQRALLFPESPSEASTALAEAGLLLRSGLGFGELELALAAVAPLSGSSSQRAARALTALAAVKAVDARFPLGAEERAGLCVALARSRIPKERFDSLVSVFAKGRVVGLSAYRLASIATATIESGRSFDAIEKEIERRARKP
ncbi:MAG: hypothetical protein Q8M76_05425 [Spirochaetaceae bacterium]|nr:hypothetical protein [Spirochaetaceae bacterium]